MKLTDLIEIKRLQILIDHLYNSNGIPISIFDVEGKEIVSTEWRDVCQRFHRVNGITCQRCIESDIHLNKLIQENKKYAISKCRNGLIDIGAPIVVDGVHVANIFQGQFFFEEPDLEFFKKQAFLANFDEDAYIKAIKETPVITQQQMKELANFLVEFSAFIADLSYANFELRNANIELNEQHQEISAVYEELVATEDELRNHYDMLVDRNDALKEATERYRLIAEGSSNVIWELDFESQIIKFSSNMSAIWEHQVSPGSPLTKLFNYIHEEDSDRVIEHFEKMLEQSDIYEDEFRIYDYNKNIKWLHLRGKVRRNGENAPTHIAGSLSEITERMTYQNYIQHMAYIDNLTGISNRNEMLLDLENIFAEILQNKHQQLSILLLNIDNYKDINDLYGHHLGDEILKSIACRLSSLNDERLKVYRYGGDEFLFIMKEDHQEVVMKTAEKILSMFHSSFEIDQKKYNLSASIGISIYPDGGTDPDRLLMNVLAALNHAKNKGKNKIITFTLSMQEALTKIKQFEHALDIAIKNNEFFLVYQPKVDVETNKVRALEALIRWRSPEKGIIPPGEFIPIAEERGFIQKIDLWVLEESIRQTIEWTKTGYDFDYISVNMSPDLLIDKNLIGHVKTLIQKYHFNNNKIQIEVTENVFIHSFDAAHQVLHELKELGFSIALDDFGKGYSSLSYLKQLPIDVLKIDKLFIDVMVNDTQPIIEFIVAMGQRLNMKVVAEGVEKTEQLELLKSYGCDLYQGYLFSTPLPPMEIKTFFEKESSSIS